MVEYEQLQPWKEKNAVILEVNSPLGATIAEKLLKMNMFVFGVDNDGSHIEVIKDCVVSVRKHEKFKFIKADLQNEDDILEVFQSIVIDYGGADMFINVMKISKSTSFLDSDTREWWDLFNRYIVGYTLCVREMLRSLVDRKVELSQIVNVINFSDVNISSRSQHRLHQVLKRTLSALNKYLDQEINPKMEFVRISTISNVIEKFEEKQLRRGVSPSQFADAVEFVINMPLHVQVRNIDLEAF